MYPVKSGMGWVRSELGIYIISTCFGYHRSWPKSFAVRGAWWAVQVAEPCLLKKAGTILMPLRILFHLDLHYLRNPRDLRDLGKSPSPPSLQPAIATRKMILTVKMGICVIDPFLPSTLPARSYKVDKSVYR